MAGRVRQGDRGSGGVKMKIYRDPCTGFSYQYSEGASVPAHLEEVEEPAPITTPESEPEEVPAETKSVKPANKARRASNK